MVDPTLPTDRSDTVCPWCSASVTPETATCPSCHAILISDEEHELPGVTAVDLAVLRGEKKAPGRSRLLSWISGEYPEETGPVAGDLQALAPPDPAVQREILRLELEAEVANLQAEVNSIQSEAAVDREIAGESAASPAVAPAATQATEPPDDTEASTPA